MSDLPVQGERFLTDLRALREFGREGDGVHRVAYSPQDREARTWLVGRMVDAGLSARIDGVGNVVGRTSGTGPAVVIGSHTDTVPHGGWLDGAYGVIAGLEVARAAQDLADPPAIEVISFADEEGAFHGTLGSTVYCGLLEPADLMTARDETGRVWGEELSACGYAGAPLALLDPQEHAAYLELHIEQGPILESAGLEIGVVSGIVGMRRHQVCFTGRADHAGATPMSARLDAGAAAIDCAAAILCDFRESAGPDTVWNIGAMRFEPGAGNVVPERAEFLVEFRDTDPERLAAMDALVESHLRAYARSSGCGVEASRSVNAPPVAMDERMMSLVEAAAARAGLSARVMPSAAGHDAMNVARQVPTGMIFVPSIAGRSHHHAEDSSDEDLVRGLRVLALAVEAAAR